MDLIELQRSIEDLSSAIRTAAIEAAESKATSYQAAESLHKSVPGLCAPFIEQWVVERLAAMIGSERLKLRKPSLQVALGLKLPKRIKWDSGDASSLYELTISETRKRRHEVAKLKLPAVEFWERAVALHEKYARKQLKITLGEAMELELKKREGII